MAGLWQSLECKVAYLHALRNGLDAEWVIGSWIKRRYRQQDVVAPYEPRNRLPQARAALPDRSRWFAGSPG